ncbi:5-methyltetrahydropteroyltriglutamate--homocysteine S-methyltransferase [Candidatus Methylacidiphilum infernorum]|uniref:5-methyltetrahydropteroyltriglutamate--homocysteine methyltransferase n=1 Tax=Methylacidiphilum infernorum (isolate V4) TaxID=481448 RepID=B3DY41_METI4|nr:5-methyltetrahydropteroyltriglutamate--homocysteine S-methyltransferase [Candidatus Methylacidiphilum infernorum]ACD82318.1 Methionine synthase II (cobalamin-independent) [Methylacidiphilum infernorum V4]
MSSSKNHLYTHILGYPRIGSRRQLKFALESYWKGESSLHDLIEAAEGIKKEAWEKQHKAQISLLCSNDFSFYDHVLDTLCLVGAVPQRFKSHNGPISLDLLFTMARGMEKSRRGQDSSNIPHPMEMTKWFDTNYHYIVPEFEKDQHFSLSSSKPFEEFKQAKFLGFLTKPILLGPISFLFLGKKKDPSIKNAELIAKILPIYEEILKEFYSLGADWIELDEPILTLDISTEWQKAFYEVYTKLKGAVPSLKILLATYFGALKENREIVSSIPIDGLHYDCTRAGQELQGLLQNWNKNRVLSLGIIDGRNVWKNDFSQSLKIIHHALEFIPVERLWLAPSCSLLFVPVSLKEEKQLSGEIKSWLAFADEKIEELATIARLALVENYQNDEQYKENQRAIEQRKTSGLIHDQSVQQRLAALKEADLSRKNPYRIRKEIQAKKLSLPLFPTTTIGSFPQTTEIRKMRSRFRLGHITQEQYDTFIQEEIKKVVRLQEEIGLDVLVHGEFERTDMVEYFGEKLKGFLITENGWVQSYGSRCVKPPIIYGDVSRQQPMTIKWSKFAQSLSSKPMKGMLTGPITLLQWSFVRDDQPRKITAKQIALAIRDEVKDLEQNGLGVIQIDEPALREGLPLRKIDWNDYLEWAIESFRIASSCVEDSTQIHTHMCYSEFGDIIEAIAKLDADVISLEASRSGLELIDSFARFRYPNDIGLGVWDIHSPRIPTVKEILDTLKKALSVLPKESLWVNPDCGLKTRSYEEVVPSLRNMVEAAHLLRKEFEAVTAVKS